MQPIQNILFLTHTCVPLSVLAILSGSMPERCLGTIINTLVIVCFFPATSNEQHVSNLNVTTLSSGPDVNTLVLATLVQFFPRDRVIVEWVIVDALLACIATVVEKNAASCNAMLCPMMDGAFMVG
jgi:hypothetical protein